MKNQRALRFTFLSAAVIVSLFASVPAVAAFTGWNVSFNGPLLPTTSSTSWVHGDCSFIGASGGNSGSCTFTITFNAPKVSFVCQVVVTITQWSIQPIQTGGRNGFWIDAGRLSASAPTPAEAARCAQLSVLPGTLNSLGEIVVPLNTSVLAIVGTYTKVDFGQIPGQIQVIVSQT